MAVLGLGGSNHDLSACVVENGRVLVYVEEERLNRKKHCLDIGMQAARSLGIDYCLDSVGMTLADIEVVATNDILTPLYQAKLRVSPLAYNHHLTHAASAFFTSGYGEAAILVVDGYGSSLPGQEGVETISSYTARQNDITLIQCQGGKLTRSGATPSFENSLGGLYLTITRGIGFGFLEEGKTMGLSAYGTDRYVGEIGRYFSFEDERFLFSKKNEAALQSFIANELAVASSPERLFAMKADFAWGVQYHLEHILLSLATTLQKKTGKKNLCLAGGVALNSVANWVIQQNAGFDQVFIPPFCADAGTAIGAAMLAERELWPETVGPYLLESQITPYLGRDYDIAEIEHAISKFTGRFSVRRPEDAFAFTADLLSDGKIIGFFQGRSEAGPRALGHRSILADPRRPDMKDIINRRIKHREPFRPFAPVVLEAEQARFFECDITSPYMLMIAPVVPSVRDQIPAVTHADGTARMQTVVAEMAPELTRMLQAFQEKTGVPVLLNTSFNDNGEPIVETPADAIRCFLNIDLDGLLIGPFLLEKISGQS